MLNANGKGADIIFVDDCWITYTCDDIRPVCVYCVFILFIDFQYYIEGGVHSKTI